MKKLCLSFVVVLSLIFTVSCVSKQVPVTETYYETEYKTEYKTETYTATEDVVVHTSEGETYLTPISKWHASIYFTAEKSGTGMTYFYGYEIEAGKHTKGKIKITLSSMAKGYIGVYNLTGMSRPPLFRTGWPGEGTVWAWLDPTQPNKWQEQIDPQTGETYYTSQWLGKVNAITSTAHPLSFRPMDTSLGNEIIFDAKDIHEFAILANTLNAQAISSVKLVWSDDIIEQQTITKERQVPYQVPVQIEKQRTVMQTKHVPFWEVILGNNQR